MLTSIRMENFRGFERYMLENLSRVNLLVGKNNCGKTTVLEAVHFLASEGSYSVLHDIARRRGELSVIRDFDGPRRDFPSIAHFFYSHTFGLDSSFKICTDDGLGSVTVKVVQPEGNAAEQLARFTAEDLERHPYVLEINLTRNSAQRKRPLVIPVDESGAIPWKHSRMSWAGDAPERQAHLLTPSYPDDEFLADLWDEVIRESKETAVIQAMQLIQEDLTGVHFLSGASWKRSRSGSGILISTKDGKRRVPLGSFGDGMVHLLRLSLALINSSGGTLLLDEIDTGLHYSIMGDLWRFVVEAAKAADVHVFATTHSLDCIRGLAWLCEHHPELGPEVSLQKLDRNLDKAVALGAEQLVLARDQDMEVR